LIGREQPAELHALGHWINTRLKAPIDALQPIDPHPDDHAASMANLIQAMETNQISTLIVLDANPAFDVPAFTAALGRVPFTAHLGAYEDETGKATLWHAPLSHPLESWSDARSADGTAGVGQPLIRPLYDSRSPVEALAALGDEANPNARDLVRRTWTDLDENAWNLALAKGVLKDTAAKPLALGPPTYVIPPPPPAGLTLSLIPHPCLWDGRYAPNAWLQECPDPLTKEVWGSALRVSRVDARRLRLKSGDRVRISARGAEAEATVLVVSGQATGVMTLPLGGGRRAAGPIGSNLGVDVGGLRGTGSAWTVPDARLEKIGGEGRVLETQTALALDGETAVLMPIFNLADLARAQPPQTPPSQFPELPRGDHAWALAIDAQACIGCNACVVACQSENNVPVVGPEDIQAGRDMHWLRIDRYDLGSDEDPQPGFSPIPCMQCEHAPCEPVCPVEASVHDHEGLNDQVYNRCVGTRFCQANCPYKVRRFNFRDYEAGHVYGDLDVTALKAQRNPEVTVRERGVMEKCTYCVQRISAARSESERTGGPIADGALKTACQSACPTQAITFGDLNDPKARVNALRLETRHYALLEHLGTRPRTTYLARVRNPNAALEKKT
jgi:Fe-S-cluster-containing dehydrogenase component